MPATDRVRWIRWFSARGLTRAEVARVLGCGEPAVADALRPRRGGPRRKAGAPGAGRLRGRVGDWCRRLAELGHDAGRIAELLGLGAAAVADFLARLAPRQAHPRRRGATLNRPRSAREQAALREWAWESGADGGPVATAVTAGPAVEAIPPAEPTEWDGPVSPHVGRIDGTTSRRGPARKKKRKTADDHGVVKLTKADRAEARRLAGEGWGVRRLARKFGVSVKTMKRLLSGESWKSDGVGPADRAPPGTAACRRPETAPGVPFVRRRTPGRSKLSAEDREEMRRLSAEGWGLRRLAARFGVSTTAIRKVLRGLSYGDDPGAPIPPRRKARPLRWDRAPKDPMHRDPVAPELADQVVAVASPAIAGAEPREVFEGDASDDVEPEWSGWDD